MNANSIIYIIVYRIMQNTMDEEIRYMDRLNKLGEWTKMNECLDE